MAFRNAVKIVRMGSLGSTYKMLLLAAAVSRPWLRGVALGLIKPFVEDGAVQIEYRCHGERLRCYLRLSDLPNDEYTFLELALRDSYRLDPAFDPDLVIDGGGNIGLFALWAAGMLRSRKAAPGRMIVIEPMPRNVEQIRRNLAVNSIAAEVLEGCVGGTRRTVPFYSRGAIDSSFDPGKPYQSVMDVPVYTIEDAVHGKLGERTLIKLDIEGMEMEVLSRFVPTVTGAVYVVGELHYAQEHAPAFETLLRENDWVLDYMDRDEEHWTFRACSPAALAMLPTMAASGWKE